MIVDHLDHEKSTKYHPRYIRRVYVTTNEYRERDGQRERYLSPYGDHHSGYWYKTNCVIFAYETMTEELRNRIDGVTAQLTSLMDTPTVEESE